MKRPIPANPVIGGASIPRELRSEDLQQGPIHAVHA